MVKWFVFGKPLHTGAVTAEDVKESDRELLKNYLEWEESDGGLCFSCRMKKKDAVYGLGENVRGINKRGWIYESNCSDDPFHREDKRSLYGAHNFIILAGEDRQFGLFIDHAV